MRFKANEVIVSEEKIIDYLLVRKDKNDKSNFLRKIGYTLENYQDLIIDILEIAATYNAVLSRSSEFGNLYRVQGPLKNTIVITIWIEQLTDNTYRFVTLYPA